MDVVRIEDSDSDDKPLVQHVRRPTNQGPSSGESRSTAVLSPRPAAAAAAAGRGGKQRVPAVGNTARRKKKGERRIGASTKAKSARDWGALSGRLTDWGDADYDDSDDESACLLTLCACELAS